MSKPVASRLAAEHSFAQLFLSGVCKTFRLATRAYNDLQSKLAVRDSMRTRLPHVQPASEGVTAGRTCPSSLDLPLLLHAWLCPQRQLSTHEPRSSYAPNECRTQR